MAKRKITAREILNDVKAGLDDRALMKKFHLSSQGLQSLFKKMLNAGVITQDELDDRSPMAERTVELGLFICPACGNIEHTEFTTCSKCGFVTPDSVRKEQEQRRSERQARISAAVRDEIGGPETPKDYHAGPRKTSAPRREGGPPRREMEFGIAGVLNYCRMLSIAALASYCVVVVGLSLVMVFFPGDGVLTFSQALLAILILQAPALAIVLTTVFSLQALNRSIKVISEFVESGLGGRR